MYCRVDCIGPRSPRARAETVSKRIAPCNLRDKTATATARRQLLYTDVSSTSISHRQISHGILDCALYSLSYLPFLQTQQPQGTALKSSNAFVSLGARPQSLVHESCSSTLKCVLVVLLCSVLSSRAFLSLGICAVGCIIASPVLPGSGLRVNCFYTAFLPRVLGTPRQDQLLINLHLAFITPSQCLLSSIYCQHV